jgi:hypothetical protein
MAVLGIEGNVRFRREAPEPIVVFENSLRADIDTFQVQSIEFWNGDEVYLSTPNGLPFSADTLPEGVGCYFGSYWDLGPNRIHVTSNDDAYYTGITTFLITQAEDTLTTQSGDSISFIDDTTTYFYNRGTPVNSGTYFIYKDQLGRLSLYDNRAAALSGLSDSRIDLKQLNFEYMLIAPAGTEEYNNALTECLAANGDYRFSDVRDEVTLASICDYAPNYLQPVAGTDEYDDAELEPRRWVGGFPWIIQGELREWNIELDAENVSTTAVGQKFGESVKSVVSGGGSFDFFIERRTDEDRYDSTALMQLLLLTEKGARAEAEFFMITDRVDTSRKLAPGDLYYKCDILVTNTAINTRASDAIVGTARFVTTGPIELKMGV